MPKLSDLHSLLVENGLALDNIERLKERSLDFFSENPGVPTFVAWSIFRGLSYDFDDNQAVPTESLAPYVRRLLPALIEWTSSVATFDDSAVISALIMTLRDCQIRGR